MPEELQEAFDELIPGAAAKAALFLQVIQQRATQEQLGFNFIPREIKKTKQIVLESRIVLGGALTKGAPMKLLVHADPIGSSLQVGWQLTEEELGALMSLSEANRAGHANRQLRNLKPENQRILSGLMKAFHLTVFLPVLNQLVDAIESSSRPQGGSGFLGA